MTPEAYQRHKARMRERYATDPVFREKQKQASRDRAKANQVRRKAQQKAWKAANPGRMQAYMRKHNRRRAGIIDATGESRHGVCPICKHDGPLVCDHWHAGPKTGMVRGWICSACNTGLGFFYDSPEALVTAAEYLRAD